MDTLRMRGDDGILLTCAAVSHRPLVGVALVAVRVGALMGQALILGGRRQVASCPARGRAAASSCVRARRTRCEEEQASKGPWQRNRESEMETAAEEGE